MTASRACILVGFASTHQKLLQDFLDKREAVKIRNCQIKKSSRDSDKLEVMVKGVTKIFPLPKKFEVSELEFHCTEATQITLSQVTKRKLS